MSSMPFAVMLMKSVAVEIDASMVERTSARNWSVVGRGYERPLYSVC